MARKCAFCEGSPVTREHVWPTRFEKYIPKPPRSIGVYRHDRGPDYQTETSHTTVSFDFKVRAPCQPCNGGWMAHLDDQAESIVASLMRGTSVYLGAESQEVLARWALKVGYTAEFLHPAARRNVPYQHRHLLRAGSLPPATYVYAAAYSGTYAGWHRLRTFDLYDGDPPRIVGKGYVIAFVLGKLALRILGYPGATGGRGTELDPERLSWVVQLHPRIAPFLYLPPPNRLGDDDLYPFTDELPRPARRERDR